VSPGTATEGVTPIFPEKKLTTFFSYHRLPVLRYHLYVFSHEHNWQLFLLIIVTFIDFTRVSPRPGGCYPHLLYPSDLVCPLFFVNLPTNFFRSGVTSLEGVTRGGAPLPLVTPSPLGVKGSWDHTLQWELMAWPRGAVGRLRPKQKQDYRSSVRS